MIKNLWSKIAYYWFIGMLIFVGLFTGKLNASELQSWSVSQSRIVYDDHGTITYGSFQSTPYTFTSNYPITGMQFRTKASDGLSMQNTYSVQFGFKPNPDAINANEVYIKGENTDKEDITCTPFYRNSNGYYLTTCSFAPRVDYTSNDYLYFRINFNSAYLTDIRSYMYGYDERLGTNAVITNQTNMINNSINDLGDDIANSTTNIINEINNSNQELLDSQKVCSTLTIDKSNIISNGYLTSSGSLISDTDYGITDYIELKNGTLKKISTAGSVPSFCWYSSDKSLLSCVTNASMAIGDVTIPTNAVYFRASINKNNNRPTFELYICQNGNQALTDTIDDDTVDDPNEFISDFEDMLPENGTITQLIGLPITLYTKVLNSINGTCTQFNLGSLYGTNLIMPCVDIDTYLGSSLWNLIDIIISGAFVLVIAKKMIKAFENFTSMKEGDVIND